MRSASAGVHWALRPNTPPAGAPLDAIVLALLAPLPRGRRPQAERRDARIEAARGREVLFDGKTLELWTTRDGKPATWPVSDGLFTVGARGGDIQTKDKFGSYKLHLEFNVPYMPKATGQARGNSGVYLGGIYELQVLDSYGLKLQDNDCGAIYKQIVPKVNASKPPLQWQTYDVTYHKAVREGDKITKKARVTVLLNSVPIIEDAEIAPTPGGTGAKEGEDGADAAPGSRQRGPVPQHLARADRVKPRFRDEMQRRQAIPPSSASSAGSSSIHRLHPQVAEPDRRALGLEPDRTFGGRGPGPAVGLHPVHGAGDRAILADDLRVVPLAHGLDRLLLRVAVELPLELRAVDREDAAGVAVSELRLDALRPDLVGRRRWIRTPLLPSNLSPGLYPSGFSYIHSNLSV